MTQCITQKVQSKPHLADNFFNETLEVHVYFTIILSLEIHLYYNTL